MVLMAEGFSIKFIVVAITEVTFLEPLRVTIDFPRIVFHSEGK